MDPSRASGRGLRSLAIVEEVVRSERWVQLQHFDSLDGKAGIMLGFAGAVAALAPTRLNLIVEGGRVAAVVGALTAQSVFWPRRYAGIDARAFRDRYLAAERSFTRLRLVDARIGMADELALILGRKVRRLRAAMGSLALAGLLVGAGLLIDWWS